MSETLPDLSLPAALGILVAIVAIGTVGLIAGGMMRQNIVLMMVTPSMVVFAAIVFAVGVMHGQHRAGAS